MCTSFNTWVFLFHSISFLLLLLLLRSPLLLYKYYKVQMYGGMNRIWFLFLCVCVCFLAIPKLWHSLFNCYRCIVSSSTVFKWMTTKWFYIFFSDRKIGVKTIILIWFGDEKKNTFSDCVHGNSVLILKRNCVRRIKEDQRNKYSLSCFSMLFHIRLFSVSGFVCIRYNYVIVHVLFACLL